MIGEWGNDWGVGEWLGGGMIGEWGNDWGVGE